MKLKLACIAMAIVCAVFVPCAAIAVNNSVKSAEEVFAEISTETLPAVASVEEDILPETISAIADESPLIAANWTLGVMYDPSLERVYLPPSKSPPSIDTNYFHNLHRIKLEGKYFGLKRTYVNGEIVKGMDFYGQTLAIRTDKGSFAEIVNEDGASYVQLTDPHEIYESIVVVDPGHGGADIGAPDSKEEIFEKDINLSIVLKLLEITDDEDILILPTRTEDVFVSKDSRAVLANMMGDYFISIHCNADEYSSSSSGTVTYYANDEKLAQAVQDKLAAAISRRDRGIVFDDGYRVLAVSEIPAVIAEMLFMTNKEDLELLTDTEVQTEIAKAFKSVIESLPTE